MDEHLLICAFMRCSHELRRFSSFLSAWGHNDLSTVLKMQMITYTLLDTCDCQLGETSRVIKITIVLCYLIFNFKCFVLGL